jgi:hypothetical protein
MSIKAIALTKRLTDVAGKVLNEDPATLAETGILSALLKEAADCVTNLQADLKALQQMGSDHA